MKSILFLLFTLSISAYGQNKVFQAIDEGSYDVLEKYIKKGKDLNVKVEKQAETRGGRIYKDKFTLLEWAVIKRAYPAIDLLLEQKEKLEFLDMVLGRSLCIAASTGDLDVSQKLIYAGADLNFRSPLFQDLNPTYISILYTNLNTFFYLAENGGDITIKDKNNISLLHQSAFTGVKKVSEYLMEEGLSPFDVDKKGRTPLMYAAWAGNFGLYQLLLNKNADYQKTSKLDESVFHFSILGESIFIIKDLIQKGVDLNKTDATGNTPLFYAVLVENIDLVKMLIDLKAEINTENKLGETPLSMALSKGNKDIVVELIESGARLKCDDKDLVKEAFGSKRMRKYLKKEWKNECK